MPVVLFTFILVVTFSCLISGVPEVHLLFKRVLFRSSSFPVAQLTIVLTKTSEDLMLLGRRRSVLRRGFWYTPLNPLLTILLL